MATLILSLAPKTRVAAAAVAAPKKNRRDEELDTGCSYISVGEMNLFANPLNHLAGDLGNSL